MIKHSRRPQTLQCFVLFFDISHHFHSSFFFSYRNEIARDGQDDCRVDDGGAAAARANTADHLGRDLIVKDRESAGDRMDGLELVDAHNGRDLQGDQAGCVRQAGKDDRSALRPRRRSTDCLAGSAAVAGRRRDAVAGRGLRRVVALAVLIVADQSRARVG